MNISGIFEKSVIVTLYLSASAATFDLNKHIVTNLEFKMHYFLIIIQSLIILFIVFFKVIFFKAKIRYSEINKWWIMSILLACMMFTGMKAIFYLPLSLFTLYKNFSIILIALLELYFFARPVTIIGFISFIVMLSSSFFANSVDKVQIIGYLWMLSNVIFTSAYAIYLKKIMVTNGSTRLESVFFTNLISIPILFAFSILLDPIELPKITPNLVISILFSGISAYFTSFSTAWSMKVLSSTSYSMLGALNKLIVSVSGFMVFNESFDIQKIFALLVGILSGMIYSLDTVKKVPQPINNSTSG